MAYALIDRFPGLRSMRAFTAAGRHMSFSKAAEELGVTPAAISHQIKTLEDYLGVPLFHRVNRGLELTAPAQAAKSVAAKGSSGSYGVQLGAFKSGPAAATRRWEHLQKEYPKLLSGLSSKVVPKKSADGLLYRLQATGLTETHARELCKSLKAKSQACVVVPPA